MSAESSSARSSGAYRVLARKYRPATFADLIGQDVLVRVLTAAIESGRLAQAFLLTGVRGVGKTTTARILARALNCTGSDGQGGPTADPCGVCEHCRGITEGRHVDVVEMDAASRTGVDDVREIIEGAQYRPVTARHKVYIIDEVHMLSKNAFNALLKTLEEPPPHVAFIFATTELRKVPVTVISRCQRFDLRRVGADQLSAHLTGVAEREDAELAPGAAAMLARAAEGSVRDALSLLDTAISGNAGAAIDEETVKDLLGLMDRGRLFDLFDHVMAGRAGDALAAYRVLLKEGADPETVLGDLLEFTHWLTRLRLTPDMERTADVSEQQAQRGADMAQRLTMPVLSRAWQILLKGFQETRGAPSPVIAAEMVLARLACAADMPDPAELVRRMTDTESTVPASTASASTASAPAAPASTAPATQAPATQTSAAARATRPATQPASEPPPWQETTPPAEPASKTLPPPPEPPRTPPSDSRPAQPQNPSPESAGGLSRFEDIAALAERRRDIRLQVALEDDVHCVEVSPGLLRLRFGPNAAGGLAREIERLILEETGEKWSVESSDEEGAPTLRQQRRETEDAQRRQIEAEPSVQAVLTAFPGSRISKIEPAVPEENVIAQTN